MSACVQDESKTMQKMLGNQQCTQHKQAESSSCNDYDFGLKDPEPHTHAAKYMVETIRIKGDMVHLLLQL